MKDLSQSREQSPENSLPVIGASDAEHPESTKARLYAWHKERGTLGVFDLLYGKSSGGARDEARNNRNSSSGRER